MNSQFILNLTELYMRRIRTRDFRVRYLFFIPDETVVVAAVEFFVVNGPQGHKFVLVLDHPVEEVLNPYYHLQTKTMSQKLAKKP